VTAGGPVAWALALPLLCASCGNQGAPGTSGRAPPQMDERIAWLLEPFPRDDYYGVDTSDTIGILLETLRHGQRDPLRAARLELARLGAAGVEAARRLIDSAWNDPNRFADIRNALDVLAYSEEPAAHDVIRRVLDHEHPSPRMAAWRALREHPRPEDYDRVRDMLDQESLDFRPELAQLLHLLDPSRAEEEFISWIAAGQNPELWREIALNLARSPRERIQRLCCVLYEGKDDLPQALLAAACARSGEPAALARLREWQRGERPVLRQVAVEALVAAELVEELVWTLEHDPDPNLRIKALRALADSNRAAEFGSYVEAALSDSDDGVASTCTALLVERGHPEAIERSLQELSSERPEAVQSAITALGPAMKKDPELSQRAFERLRELDEVETGRSIAQRRTTLRAIGQVPLEESARYLHGLARDAQGQVQGLATARWLVLQAGNAGESGQRYLIRALGEERDPVRRLDLIEALAGSPTELARSWLLERAETPDVAPYELLYIADRLVRLGPLERVAPVLKRATLRVEQADVRRSLQGLLWTWYPGPSAS